MSTTKTTTKRAAVLARLDAETDYAYVVRMTTDGGADAIDAAEHAVLSRDDAARLHTFTDRVARSVLAGLTAVARATFVIGSKPDDYAAVSKALGVSTDGGSYLGRKYSTLRECYRLAATHTPEREEAFVAAYRDATGTAPEQVREYVSWAAAAGTGREAAANRVEKIKERKVTAEANGVKAAAAAAERRTVTASLRTAGKVSGCPLTAEQWAAMPEEVLRQVALLAESLAVGKGAAKRAAARAATAAVAAAETGPAPKRAARTKIAA